MKISYNWLKELLPGLTQTPQAVAEILTLHSFETVIAGKLEVDSQVRVVKIIKIEKHPNADRLRLATITDGEKVSTVVCGAPNIEVGQVVPYSPPGATLKDEEGNDFMVREATIRGQKSPGMLNSLRELGLHKEHGGIWVLDTSHPNPLPRKGEGEVVLELGKPLRDYVPADTILEADITPNRAHDCLSHVGIARELAALLKLSVQEPVLAQLPAAQESVDGWSVSVADPTDSPRYLAALLLGATIAPSPLWLQARLLAVGCKPINNLVDITNYVLFEIGNPTHLFDAESLSGKKISVRRAQAGEKLAALDEGIYNLMPEDVVITSDDKPVAIAGVMGGLETGIKPATKQVLLEVANFRPYLIQETSRRLNLRSESSARFSKGIQPSQVAVAAARIVQLLQDIAGVSVAGVIDVYPTVHQSRTIQFRPHQPAKIAGVDIDTDEAADILRRLRCVIDDSNDVWEITVPNDRLDLEGEHDLVEEVIRVVGLSNIPAKQLPETEALPLPGEIHLRERLRDNLVALGFTETYNYSFEPAAYAELAGLSQEPHLSLTNPPAPELQNLRVNLLPGLLANLVTNRTVFQRNAGKKESALFEVGSVYRAGEGDRVPGVIEELHVAGAIVGSMPTQETIIQAIADAFGIEQEVVKKTGIIRPLEHTIQQKLKYRLPITMFEFSLSQLVQHAGEKTSATAATLADIAQPAQVVQFVPYSKYPSVIRDISMLVDPAVTVEQAQEVIERIGGELVVDVDLFDEFEPKATGRKSLAFHVEYQSSDRTLTDDEVSKIHEKITQVLKEELSAEIR